ncbi:uncharacterized protein B0P05DRAFT_469808 [Gilbertella persicaria]|uniref:uncharacterized protein n=1 Tax=Gilbertella persicaria TaxID=101096 RepID=UPI002220D1B9|nr:uncharacterized protein B0P05DRAFT_469808 [Gilbertella persicaria]KAI8079542.1 hypothetical protein B0P05DRAFT_469808 [Gilbertella persicaria]
MFIDPSPVPRFRNVAPPPPPSPPYLNVLIDTPDNDLHSIIKSPAKDEDEPTIYTSRESMTAKKEPEKEPAFLDEHEHQMSRLIETLKLKPPSKLRLDFYPPFVRGQTLKFSLQNTIPEDHIILFKFLTSNANYTKGQPERYFIRPSAGKMASTDQTEIFLFLNQIPTEVPLSEETGNLIKDKIMIRWAVIQRNTQIETWVNKLQESTRRRWIDMLDEEWPDQVTIRMTRIKIRFHV